MHPDPGRQLRYARPKTPDVDWTGVPIRQQTYKRGTTIVAQGDAATSVMYVHKGTVRLSVASRGGKEAVIAVLPLGHFFGEGCLAGQPRRVATASALSPCTIIVVEKRDMAHQLHTRPAFADTRRNVSPPLAR